MENPDTWGLAEKVVQQALEEGAEAFSKQIIGISLARRITDALRARGLLDEADIEAAREHHGSL